LGGPEVKALVPSQRAKCDLCGDELAAPFVRVGHVKKRALCTDDEKRDVKNVLVACVWCDVAFERGWISLDSDQRVVVSGSLPVTEAMGNRRTRHGADR
jgi:predicted restriction endonuclease